MTSLGLTNSQIAARLNITTHAVKFHLSSIFRKLGVGNRTEAVVLFVRNPRKRGSTPGPNSTAV